MLSAKQRSRMAKKARRRCYLKLREQARSGTDWDRFQYACRVPIMRQVQLALDLTFRPRPSWEPPHRELPRPLAGYSSAPLLAEEPLLAPFHMPPGVMVERVTRDEARDRYKPHPARKRRDPGKPPA